MKKLLLLLALATPAFAQVTPATPSGFATKAEGAIAGGTATVTTGEKAKPLSAADKKFVKDSLDGIFYILDLNGKVKANAKTEVVKTLGGTLNGDLNKIYTDVAGFASEKGEKVPSELTGGDKSKAERLGKVGDKFDKEFTKIVSKEIDKLAKIFEGAAKGVQDLALKEFSTKWTATLKDDAVKADAAEKEAAKAK